MKKSFVLLLVMVLLFTGTACYAQNELLKERDQVHFTESIIYGDKSVVEGVTVEMHNEYSRHIFWHTIYEVASEPNETTEYEFYPWAQYDYEYNPTGSLSVLYHGMSEWDIQSNKEGQYTGLDAAMKELYDSTGAGETKEKTIYLKDYLDYYSFELQLELPKEEGKSYKSYGDSYFFFRELETEIAELEKSGSNPERLAELKRYQKDLNNFQNYFKIPVVETEIYMLALAKDESGNIIGMAESGMSGGTATGDIDFPEIPLDKMGDSFRLDLEAAFVEGVCYLVFDAHTENGNIVDTSHIPGGYGIYSFSYDSENGSIDSENIEMIYALDPSVTISSIAVDASGEKLFLYTDEKGRIYLSVIDRDTMTLEDKIDVGSVNAYFTYWTYEDYLITLSDDLTVYTIDTDGHYVKEFSVNVEEMERKLGENSDGFYFSWKCSFDWDGERLLMGNCLYRGAQEKCMFSLSVIDETGLVYYGEYDSSLLTSDVEYTGCRPDTEMEFPLTVKWNNR